MGCRPRNLNSTEAKWERTESNIILCVDRRRTLTNGRTNFTSSPSYDRFEGVTRLRTLSTRSNIETSVESNLWLGHDSRRTPSPDDGDVRLQQDVVFFVRLNSNEMVTSDRTDKVSFRRR